MAIHKSLLKEGMTKFRINWLYMHYRILVTFFFFLLASNQSYND